MTDTDPLGGIPSVGKKSLVSEYNVTFNCCLNEDILPVPREIVPRGRHFPFHQLGKIFTKNSNYSNRYLRLKHLHLIPLYFQFKFYFKPRLKRLNLNNFIK